MKNNTLLALSFSTMLLFVISTGITRVTDANHVIYFFWVFVHLNYHLTCYCTLSMFVESLLTSDPVFSKEDVYVLDREKAYERALQKGLQLVKLRKKHNITDLEDIKILRRYWTKIIMAYTVG